MRRDLFMKYEIREVVGYENLYMVDTEGNVFSVRNDGLKVLKPEKNNDGYLRVKLYKYNVCKRFYVHRLVLSTFCPNENSDNLTVNHKDEDKTHNWINNLEWCDTQYNLNYGNYPFNMAEKSKGNCRAGKKVECVETGIIYKSMLEANRQTGINNASISHVLNGRAKTAGGYHWRFADE